MTQSQVLCIKSIPYDGISQINLSYKLSLDLSTVSRNLDKLKNMKIINKSKLKHDQRSSIITLTNKGKKIYKEIIVTFENDINQLILNIDHDDIDYLTEILNKINWEFELHYNKNE